MKEEIVEGLRQLIQSNTGNRHIITWYDEDGENVEFLNEIKAALDGVDIVVYDNNPLFVRSHILNDIPNDDVIIYRAEAQPEPTSNPLVDIELANIHDVFIPDDSTLILNALGLSEMFRGVVTTNSRFFKNQKRIRDINKFLPIESPEDLQMAIYAALFDSEDKRFERVLVATFCKYRANRDEFVNLLKFVDRDGLAVLLGNYFGFDITNIDELDELWTATFVTYFKTTLSETVDLSRYSKLLLPASGNARIFIRDLMNLTPDAFREFSTEISNKYLLDRLLGTLDINDYIDCDAIAAADDQMIFKLIELLDHKHDISEYVRRRETGFYYSIKANDYAMLSSANNFRLTVRQLIDELKVEDKDTAIKHYADNLYLVDTSYRHFNYFYNLTAKNDEYINLANTIEYIYNDEWILKLADKWESSVSNENWTATKHTMISDFYDTYLRPLDNKKDRVFVIVSDGLRYEVAKQIANAKNLAETGGDVTSDFVLSLLPSITPVGMAALLPHSKLEFDGTSVTADGNKTDSTSRDAVLKIANPDNLAIRFEEVRNMKKSEWKSFFSGKKYVYIYHDKIDITGEHDDAATFAACEVAISEISDLIVDLHTTFSGVNVIVTADHGFFYQAGTIEARGKMPKLTETDKQKARYAISNSTDKTTLNFRLGDMFVGNEKFVNTPHASVVFAKQGGVGRYYHGGALPQEVIVPVLNFKSSRNSATRDKVDITYTGMSLKITNAITYLTFLQNEPVGVDKLSARYKLYFEDKQGEKISDEVTIIADSTEKEASSREYREKFAFAARNYVQNEDYFLVVKDENGIETDRIGFRIDIAIINDLGL